MHLNVLKNLRHSLKIYLGYPGKLLKMQNQLFK